MTFVNGLFSLIVDAVKFIGDLIYQIFTFIFYLIDGIIYFIGRIFLVIVEVVKIFVALFQFFIAIVTGFLRTIGNMLSININNTPINYPSETQRGINAAKEFLGTDLLNIVPLILIAIVWFVFAKRLIGLIGGTSNASGD